ncbi:MAG TPA: hypothetical protein PLW60_05825 [Bacilli bacterium]|nr:MAG: hypothetical protein BWY97_00095 [Tenericutes bacterium ADurb.BinA124]HNZ50744.1 hypothetical protein [Bacilli bacterium]HPX84617.1 hypothetical protein [Bacilli bacterium]HQC75025.1 hypothetical protein [Bacilli bacterium]
MPKTKKKLRALRFWSWFCLLAPIVGVLGFNAKDYFTWQTGFVFPQAVEVSLGIVFSAAAGVLLALGKTSALKGSKGFWAALIIAILLKSILNDLILILTAVAVGSTMYGAFQPAITETLETYKFEKQATIQANAMSNVMQATSEKAIESEKIKTVRRGRV